MMGYTELFTFILSIINSFGLTFGSIWLRRESKRVKSAEAAQIEINNAILAGDEWKKIAHDYKGSLILKDTKIDQLYLELGEWRNKYNELLTRHNVLGIENAKQQPRTCNRPGCPNREAQTGF